MSSAPPGIVRLQVYRTAQLGSGKNLGIVGDSNHKMGYHLGPDRTPVGDPSERLARDKSGARQFPVYASAEDSSMAWNGSRQWLAGLVRDCRAGEAYTRDIREIIGSLDGKTALYWDSQTGFNAVRYTGSGHITHTHISFFRDSALRDQSDVLRMYLEPPTPDVKELVIMRGPIEIPQRFAYRRVTGTDGKPSYVVIDPTAIVSVAGEWTGGSYLGYLRGSATISAQHWSTIGDQTAVLLPEVSKDVNGSQEWLRRPEITLRHKRETDWVHIDKGEYAVSLGLVENDYDLSCPMTLSLDYAPYVP